MWHIDGSAYNLEPLRGTHPGGSYILDSLRGQDCTAVYFSSHPTASCAQLRGRIRPYVVEEGEGSKEWGDTGLYDDLKAAVRSYRGRHGSLGAPLTAWVWYGYWIRWLCMLAPPWLDGSATAAQMVALGWTLWILVADLTHSGTHGAVVRMPRGRVADAALVALRCACAPFCVHAAWVRQHIIGHHAHTNTPADPDVHHHPRDRVGWRVAPWTAAKAAYRGWVASFVLGVWLTQLQPCLVNAAAMACSGRYPGARVRVRWVGWERAWCSLQTAAMWWLVLSRVHQSGAAALTPFAVCGALFYCFSQVSHINEASFRCAGSPEWARRQVQSASGDYAAHSPLVTLLSIGLNQQALHHLFPTVHPFHYPALAPVFDAVLRRHGIEHCAGKRTFGDAVRDHFDWLGRLNNDFCG